MSRMPSTSTGDRQGHAPLRARRGRPRCAAGCPTGGSTSPSTERAPRAAWGPPGSDESSGTTADERLLEQVSTSEAPSWTGSVTTAWASSPVEHLGDEPLGRAFVDPQPDAGGAGAQDRRRGWARSSGSRSRRSRSWRRRPRGPAASTRSARSASSSRRTRRARSRTRPRTRWGPPPGGCGSAADAELVLELADLLGDVRLDRAQGVGGGGERAFLGDGEQRVEMAELHLPHRLPSLLLDGNDQILTVGQIAAVAPPWGCRTPLGAGIPPSAPRHCTSTSGPTSTARGQSVAIDTVSNLIFTGPLAWTVDAACDGQTSLFFAPAGERPETRVAAREPGPGDLPGLPRARPVPRLGPRPARSTGSGAASPRRSAPRPGSASTCRSAGSPATPRATASRSSPARVPRSPSTPVRSGRGRRSARAPAVPPEGVDLDKLATVVRRARPRRHAARRSTRS